MDITLDPDTAAAWLVLSPDGKKVKSGKMMIVILFFFTAAILTKNVDTGVISICICIVHVHLVWQSLSTEPTRTRDADAA